MSTVRKLGVIAAVVLVLSLSACTSSTAPALTRAANAAKAAAAAAVKAETAAKAAAEAAEKAEAVAEAAAARRATTSTTVAAVPTLGLRAGIFAHGKGFGEVKPSEVFNGGDPTGLVTHVVWKSWGGREAVGMGESEYVAPNQDVAEGSEQPATVVAFKLGTCTRRSPRPTSTASRREHVLRSPKKTWNGQFGWRWNLAAVSRNNRSESGPPSSATRSSATR